MTDPQDPGTLAQPPQSRRHIVLVMDVDGVVSPVKGKPTWGDPADGGPFGLGTVWVSPRLNAELDLLADMPTVRPVWLTSWSDQMRAPMAFPGHTWESLAPEGPLSLAHHPDDEWWKLTVLLDWLETHPEIDTTIWCDDHLNSAWFDAQDDYDVMSGYALTNAHVAAVNLARRGIDLFPICPRTDAGLTAEHAAEIERIVRFRPSPATISLPTPPPIPDARSLPWWAAHPRKATCGNCNADNWWTCYYPDVIRCSQCDRYFVAGTDITEVVTSSGV